MVRKSSFIFAATLAVFSTLEVAYGAGGVAAADTKYDVQRPRFIKKNVKRFYGNTTTSSIVPGRGNGLDGLARVDPVKDFQEIITPSSTTTTTTPPSTPESVSSPTTNPQNQSPTTSPDAGSTTTSPPPVDDNSSSAGAGTQDTTEPADQNDSSTTHPPAANSSPTTTGSPDIVDSVVEKGSDILPTGGDSSKSSPAGQPDTKSATKTNNDDILNNLPSPSVDLGAGVGKAVDNTGKTTTSPPASGSSPTSGTGKGSDDDDELNVSDSNGSSRSVPGVVKPSDVVDDVQNDLDLSSKKGSSTTKGTDNNGGSDEILPSVSLNLGGKEVSNSPVAQITPKPGQVVDDTKSGVSSLLEPDESQKAGNSETRSPGVVGNVIDDVKSGASVPASILSNGVLVKNPSITAVPIINTEGSASENEGNSKPASIISNGVLIPNPEVSKVVDDLTNGKSNSVSVSLPVNVPASITSGGVLIPNPVATGLTGALDSVVNQVVPTGPSGVQSLGGSLGSEVSSGVQDIKNVVPASITLSDGNVIANPSLNLPVTNLPASVTLSNGQVIANPSLNLPVSNLPASVTLSNGEVIANPSLKLPVSNLPASVTLSNGQVIANPSLNLPATNIPASVTLSNGDVIANPSLAKASPVVTPPPASITLPNGSVVPNPSLAASIPTGASEGTNVSNGSGENSETSIPAIIPGEKEKQPPTQTPLPGEESASITGSPSIHKPAAFFERPGTQSLPSGASAASGEGSGAQGTATQSPGSGASATGQPSVTAAGAGPGVSTGSQQGPNPTTGPIASGPQSYPKNGKGPFSQQPIGFDKSTVLPVESSIVFEPSSAPATTGTETAPTGLPSDVPLVLYPPTGKAKRPDNSVLIQLGWLFPLNYDFVWQHDQSQRQLFTYTPLGVAHCLGINRLNVTMRTLQAWDTTQDLHYITTLALMWIPEHLVNPLELALHSPGSSFYNQPDPSIRTLFSMINNAIPIRADNMDDSGSDGGASPTNTAAATGAAPVGGNIGSSSPVKASSVGIGVGVVCGAAAYGAAMFFVARRYKKRRQSHMRSPSMFSSPVMSHAGGDPAAGQALMSGAMGGGERSISPYYDRAESRGSARSGGSSGRQQISAPVMAENSLGWN